MHSQNLSHLYIENLNFSAQLVKSERRRRRRGEVKAEGQVKATKFSRMPSSRNTVFKNGVGPCAVSGDTGAVVSSSLVESLGIISGAVIALKHSKSEPQQWNKLSQTIQVRQYVFFSTLSF